MKVITYSNPFELEQLPDWGQLCKFPHLCVSQTLVEGLKEYYSRETFTLLCTVDQMLEAFYDQWHNNAENQMLQFIYLSKAIKKISDCDMKRAFTHNKEHVLKAIRFMIEAGVHKEDIDEDILTIEQKFFVKLYNELSEEGCFKTLDMQSIRGREGLIHSTRKILKDEYCKYITLSKEEEINNNLFEAVDDELIIEKMKDSINDQDDYNDKKDAKSIKRRKYIAQLYLKTIEENTINFNTVVLHGIHQFTPLILKFIAKLEELNINVICMFNYLEEYSSIYQTWDEVYRWTHVTMQHYGNTDGIIPRRVGENLGYIFEGQLSKCSKTSEVINKFTNLTAFADYVAVIFAEAKDKAEQLAKENDRRVEDIKKLEIIARMDEQFYAVNGNEFNEILKVYFPEHFGGRHFLTYPIGQFILGLYNMWDKRERKIIVDEKNLKECLAFNIWRIKSKASPLEIYCDLKVYFKGAKSFEEYKDRLNKIIQIIEKRKDKSQVYNRLKKMSFFKYSIDEVKEFIKVIESLQNIAANIFPDEQQGESQVDIKRHYEELINYLIDITKGSDITKEEFDFIEHIKRQLQQINMEDIVADIDDIRETLHFYLADTTSDNEAEWIVRDFEQIDGGILLAKAENKSKNYKEPGSTCFHYGGISDTNMLRGRNSDLPWPLTLNMINKMNRITKIITTCKKEYANFLRYCLFYGTYFLSTSKDVIFSYVEEEENKRADPYSILTLLRLKEEDKSERDLFGESTFETTYNITNVQDIEPLSLEEKRAANVCYRRYLLNCCLDMQTTFNEDFDVFYIAQVFAAMSLAQVKTDGKDVSQAIKQFEKIFPFMTRMDFMKVERMASYFSASHLADNEYLDARLEYKHGQWTVEGENVNLLAPVYAANRIGHEKTIRLMKALDQYINSEERSFLTNNHNWKLCDVCNQKYVCCYYVKVREEKEWEEGY